MLWVNNPDYIKKIRLKLWLGNTPKRYSLYEINEQDLIIPYGMRDTLFRLLKELNIEYELDTAFDIKTAKTPNTKPLTLYDYQQRAVDEMLRYDNGILVSPAGSGKTRMGMYIIGQRKVKTLWVTHTLDLLRQSKRAYKEFYGGKVGEIAQGKVDIQDVTFATVQTLNNLDLPKYRNEWSLLIIDEAHRVGGTPNRVMMFYKVLTNLNAKYKYGLTATLYDTPNDMSSVPLYLVGDKRVEIQEKNIPRITAEHIPIMLDTPMSDSYLDVDRTVNFNLLTEYIVYNVERNETILKKIIDNKDRHNIVLTTRNDHLELIAQGLEYNNIKYEILVGSVKPKDRERMLKDFELGKYKILLSNYQLTKEGLNLPIADTLHLIFPMRDKTTIVQSKGRVERLYKGKDSAIVYDYVDRNISLLYDMYRERRKHFE